jgi:hypothetical protein
MYHTSQKSKMQLSLFEPDKGESLPGPVIRPIPMMSYEGLLLDSVLAEKLRLMLSVHPENARFNRM